MREGILIRFSDFVVNAPYHIIIKDIEKNEFHMEAFLLFDVYMPLEKGVREFQVIFPKYKFKKAYLTYPLRKRIEVGRTNVFMEIYKLPRGQIKITRLEQWTK